MKIGDCVAIKNSTISSGRIGQLDPASQRARIDFIYNGKENGAWFNFKDIIVVESQISSSLFPINPADRKTIPVASGVLDYFASALIEIAKVSYAGNEQHNPGQPLHWARGKSADQADTMLRHFLERGTLDTDGQRHSAKMTWRALAILQLELEEAGAPIARAARIEEKK
jgi:hypothetical protein